MPFHAFSRTFWRSKLRLAAVPARRARQLIPPIAPMPGGACERIDGLLRAVKSCCAWPAAKCRMETLQVAKRADPAWALHAVAAKESNWAYALVAESHPIPDSIVARSRDGQVPTAARAIVPRVCARCLRWPRASLRAPIALIAVSRTVRAVQPPYRSVSPSRALLASLRGRQPFPCLACLCVQIRVSSP